MLTDILVTLASFTAPYEVKMNPQSMLWMLPLAAAVAIIYKVIKQPRITALNFIKESVVLFASIVLFLIATSAALWLVAYLAVE